MILVLKDALKAPKNDVFKTISSQISQNTLITSSIILNFLPIINCYFGPKSCSKGSKYDVLKTISSQIIFHGPSSSVNLNVGYYHRARSWLWNREALVGLISRACSYQNRLLFASYTLTHLYQIMIRSWGHYILKDDAAKCPPHFAAKCTPRIILIFRRELQIYTSESDFFSLFVIFIAKCY